MEQIDSDRRDPRLDVEALRLEVLRLETLRLKPQTVHAIKRLV